MQLVRAVAVSAALLIGLLANIACAQDKPKTEVVPQVGHSGFVGFATFSADGARILSLGETLKLWDVATGALLRTFEGNFGAVAFSRGAGRVVSGSDDGTVKLWDAASGALLRTFKGHSSRIGSVAFSPDSRQVLSGSWDDTVKLWDAASGALLRSFEGKSGLVDAVAFSPDGKQVLSGGATLKLWDAASGALLRIFEGQKFLVRSVSFSPDGRQVLSRGEDSKLRLWDAASGALLRTFPGHWGSFSSDGARVVSSGGWDKTVKMWDAGTGALLRTFMPRSDWGAPVAFSPDGAHVLSQGSDKTLILWDAATGRLLRTLVGRSDRGMSVALSPGGARVLSGRHDSPLQLWDATAGRLMRSFERGSVNSVAFSPDGARVIAGGVDTTLKLWDATTGALLRIFEGHSGVITSVAFSPDGGRVLAGSSDKTMKLWDAATGILLRTFMGHSRGVNCVAFSSNGAHVLSGSEDGTLKLWDAGTGHLLLTIDVKARSYSVAFSLDDRQLLSGGRDRVVKLWDRGTGRLLRSFEGHSGFVNSVVFSPDGARVLSGSHDMTVKLWNVATGRLLRTFAGHSGQVLSVAFSQSGHSVISGSVDGTIRFWNVTTGKDFASLVSSPDGNWLAIVPDGFFASSPDGAQMLRIVRGFDVTTIEQVHQSLFNPDLVRETLAGDPSGEVREAAKVINLEKVLDSGPAPIVVVTSPAEDSQSGRDLVTVTARIDDRGKGIGRIEWRVNAITAAVAAKPPGVGPVYNLTQQLALDPGDNTIEVVAYNAGNLLASLPARTTIKLNGPAEKTMPKLHILAIGINSYVDRGSPLRFGPLDLAVKDAMAFGASMKRAATGLYEEVRVTLALDGDATRDNLNRIVDRVAADIHPRDSFILFAAGHGTSENARFYFIPQDYQSGPGNLARHAIGQDRLQDWLANRIKAKQAIILLDTCESGALVAGHARSRADAPASEAAVGRLHEATGRPILTAAAAGQFAHEGLIGATGERHGVFTWAVLDALHKGDTNGNGLIELSELVRHVQSVVPKIAADLGGTGRAATSEPEFGKNHRQPNNGEEKGGNCWVHERSQDSPEGR